MIILGSFIQGRSCPKTGSIRIYNGQATDAMNILKHVMQLATISDEIALELVDVDHYEDVTASDALGVLKVVVKLQEKELYNGK